MHRFILSYKWYILKQDCLIVTIAMVVVGSSRHIMSTGLLNRPATRWPQAIFHWLTLLFSWSDIKKHEDEKQKTKNRADAGVLLNSRNARGQACRHSIYYRNTLILVRQGQHRSAMTDDSTSKCLDCRGHLILSAGGGYYLKSLSNPAIIFGKARLIVRLR